MEAQSAVFVLMGLSQLMLVFNLRRDHVLGLDRTLPRNPWMIGALLLSTGLLVLAVYLPVFQNVMPTAPLSAGTWALVAALAAVFMLINEGLNRFVLRTKKPRAA